MRGQILGWTRAAIPGWMRGQILGWTRAAIPGWTRGQTLGGAGNWARVAAVA